MRTLLRHISTGQYFRSLDSWTDDAALAHDFKRIGSAMRFAEKTGWPEMELVIALDTPPIAPTLSWQCVRRNKAPLARSFRAL